MKNLIQTFAIGLAVALTVCTLAPPAGYAASVGNGVFVNETFDPPTIVLDPKVNLWSDGVSDLKWEYVSDGVQGTTAVRVSGTLDASSGYAGATIYQNGFVLGNDRATRESTRLSFDLKIDKPGFEYVGVALEGWQLPGYDWGAGVGADTVSQTYVAVGPYTPGKFKTLVVPLDAPVWAQRGGSPLFDPAAKTIQVLFQVDGVGLPGLGSFGVTVDNIALITKNPMVDLVGKGSGTYSLGAGNILTVVDKGVAEHLGNYTLTATFYPNQPFGLAVINASNGSSLTGIIVPLSTFDYALMIQDGDGRFAGAAGGWNGTFSYSETAPTFTSVIEGTISTVGSSK